MGGRALVSAPRFLGQCPGRRAPPHETISFPKITTKVQPAPASRGANHTSFRPFNDAHSNPGRKTFCVHNT